MKPAAPDSRRDLLLAGLFALAVGLPFVNKPFHIDDTIVLAVTRQILKDPLHPLAGTANWFGSVEPMFRVTTNPPLISYYLAPLVLRFGYCEVALHAAMLLFLVVLAAAMVDLSRRFCRGSWWPVLFVVASPATVVSNNVMRDTAMTALVAAAVALFIRGVDEDRWKPLLAGSLLAGCAVLVKYSGVVVFPVCVAYVLLCGRQPLKRRPAALAWLLAGLALVGLWCAQNVWAHGEMHLQYLLAKKRTVLSWQEHGYSALTIIGACCFLTPAMVAGALGSRSWWRVALYAPAVPLVWTAVHHHFQPPPDGQYLLWAELGGCLFWVIGVEVVLFLLTAVGRAVVRRPETPGDGTAAAWRDELFLAFWLFLVTYFSIRYVLFPAVRHLLPALGPLCLLSMRALQRLSRPSVRVETAALAVCLGAQMVVTFWVGAADYAYAGTYRRYVRAVAPLLRTARGRVWFMGNWGWQFYARAAGWKLIATNGPLPHTGDLIIVPDRVHKGPLPDGLEGRLERVSETTYRTRLHLFTMNDFAGGSFYAVVGRNVPYYFSTDDTLETFRLYRVKPGSRKESG